MLDKTTQIEEKLKVENKPKLKYLPKLFLHVFSSAKAMCTIFLLLSILLSLLRPVLSFIWGSYVDLANNYTQGDKLISLILLLISYYVIDFITTLLYKYTRAFEEIERLDVVQKNRFQEKFDTKMYKKLSNLPSEYFEVASINDRIERVFNFTQDAWDGLNMQVMVRGYNIISKLISLIMVGLSLYIIEPYLCIIVVIAPIPKLYTTFISEKIKFKFVKDNSKSRREAKYYEKLMLKDATKEIKVFGLHDFIFSKWKKITDEYIRKEQRAQILSIILEMISSFISSIVGVAATILSIILMVKGRISLGALGAAISLTQTLLNDTNILFSSIGGFIAKKNEAAMFYDLVDLEEETENNKIDSIEGIEVKDLFYRYPMTDKYVLEDISLSIKKGEHIAFVGQNGAGKTTLVRILSGILAPSKGELIVNGKTLDKANYYNSISSVLQSPAKYYTFTVGENVIIGDINKNGDVNDALSLAGFNGASTDALLGKDIGGIELSGGEWQKLSIARAHYRNRDFVILDEPTGNLDPKAEADVFERYLELSQNKTLIMVTHRISVASLANRIIVFLNGHIVEDGTHEELLSLNGEYSRLYHEQAKWYDR